jgi:hypothetical protein
MPKFTRQDLRDILGSAHTEEIENKIMSLHLGVVDSIKDDLAKARADAEKLPTVEAELTKIKDEVAKNGGKDAFKVKYEAIKEEFENYKKDQTAKETKAKKQDAYRDLLKEAGVSDKRLEAVLRVSNIDGISLDKDGNIEGKDALLKGIKEEWADFIQVKSSTGTNNPTPPASNGGSVRKTKEEIYAIKDPAERQQAILDNHELFGI